MLVWDFEPLTPVSENHEWLTDVMQAKTAEQRIAMRAAPRISLELSHILNEQEYAKAREIIEGDLQALVPNWVHAISGIVIDTTTGSFVTAQIDGDHGLYAGQQAIVFKSIRSYEIAQISSVSGSTVILEGLTVDCLSATVAPLYVANISDGMDAERKAGGWTQVSIDASFVDAKIPPIETYALYRGLDVLTDCPAVAGGSFGQPVSWQNTKIDNDTGRAHYSKDLAYSDSQLGMRWHVQTEQEKINLRAWFSTRRGRQKAFWFSTNANDFLPWSNFMGATVRIKKTLTFVKTNFDIEIESNSGLHKRQATVIGIGADFYVLQLSSAVSIPMASIKRISQLKCVRLSSDRVEFNHAAGEGMTCRATFNECPKP